jgi:hypothetical protein
MAIMTDVRPRESVANNSAVLDHVFISYSRRDQPYVSRLVTELHSAGITSWTAGPGRHSPAWRDEIFPHIANCAAFVVVMTPWSQVAGGVAEEISFAQSLGKEIIPIPGRLAPRQCSVLLRCLMDG